MMPLASLVRVAGHDHAEPGMVGIVCEVVMEAEVDGRVEVFARPPKHVDIDPARAVNELVEAAYSQREDELGDVMGDMGMHGLEVPRFEVYAAPFRIEVAEELRARLDLD